MAIDVDFLRQVYARFNARDIEAVLAALHTDVTSLRSVLGLGGVYFANPAKHFLVGSSAKERL
jgi:hypothetical protein